MDISLCILDKDKKKLQYAGANSPLYLIRNGMLKEVKGNRYSIGLTDKGDLPKFDNNEIELEIGDVVYIFSDGYADQISHAGEKFMYNQFRELLGKISSEPMPVQEKILKETLANWRGEFEQIDDVLVIGFKI
jgi:serine phosphatase RsbU (regulator of sigma subunit)